MTTAVIMPKMVSVTMGARGRPLESVLLARTALIVALETPVRTPVLLGTPRPTPITASVKMAVLTPHTVPVMPGQTVRTADRTREH